MSKNVSAHVHVMYLDIYMVLDLVQRPILNLRLLLNCNDMSV